MIKYNRLNLTFGETWSVFYISDRLLPGIYFSFKLLSRHLTRFWRMFYWKVEELMVVQTITALKPGSKDRDTFIFVTNFSWDICILKSNRRFLFEFCFPTVCFPKLGNIKDRFYNYYYFEDCVFQQFLKITYYYSSLWLMKYSRFVLSMSDIQ